MKKFIFLILFLIYINQFVLSVQHCQQDYQCGNCPYSGCLTNLNILPGLEFDEGTGKLYIIGKYNSTGVKNFGDPYLVSIDSSSGAIKQEKRITFEIPEGGGGRTVFNLYLYVPAPYNYFYVTLNQIGSPILALLNQDASNYSQIWNFRNVPLQFLVETTPPRTIQGDFGIHVFDYILTSRPKDPDAKTTIYRDVASSGLSVQGDDIYIATYPGTFYRGSMLCQNCSKDTLVKLFVDPTYGNTEITDFLTTSSYIYYSSELGITEMPINGDLVKRRVLTSEPVISIAYSNSGYLFYSVRGENTIKKISLAGNHPQTTTLLSPSIYSQNTCDCNHGLTGSDCSCDGTVFWTGGQPFCTKNNSKGWPETCFYEWQCPGSPFSLCASGTCKCRDNFQGSDCGYCPSGNVSWSGGIPNCGP